MGKQNQASPGRGDPWSTSYGHCRRCRKSGPLSGRRPGATPDHVGAHASDTRVLSIIRRSSPDADSWRDLRHNFYAVPESDVMLDMPRLRGGLRVIPRGFAVHLAVDHDVVITRDAFPEAGRVFRARAQVLAFHRLGREIIMALDDPARVAFGQYRAVPDCLRR